MRVESILQLIRGVVRPIVTISGWLAILLFIRYHEPIPTELFALVSTFTTWWFAERVHNKNNGDVSNGK